MPINLLFDEALFRPCKQCSKIGKAYYYQSRQIFQISREVIIGRTIDKTDEVHNRTRSFLQKLCECFDCIVTNGKSDPTMASKAVSEMKEVLKHFVMFKDMSSLYSALNIDQLMDHARKEDEKALRRKTAVEKIQNAVNKMRKTSRKIQAEVLIYGAKDWSELNVYPQYLDEDATLEVLLFWLVERKSFKVKLHDNPHFYPALPSPKNCFNVEHLSFRQPLKLCEKQLHVLVDHHSRIFLKSSNDETVLGNIWEIGNTIVLKDIHGTIKPASSLFKEGTYQLQLPKQTSDKEGNNQQLSTFYGGWYSALKEAMHVDGDVQMTHGISTTPPPRPDGDMEHIPPQALESHEHGIMGARPARSSAQPLIQREIEDDSSDPVHQGEHSRVPTIRRSRGNQPLQPTPSPSPTQEPEMKRSPSPKPPQLPRPTSVKTNNPPSPQSPKNIVNPNNPPNPPNPIVPKKSWFWRAVDKVTSVTSAIVG